MSTATSETLDAKKSPMWSSGHGHDAIATRTLGFWLYMLSDAMMFAALFVAYTVLGHAVNAAGGPWAATVAHPGVAFKETVWLFSSVLAYGFAMIALKRGHRGGVMLGIAAALLIALGFLSVDIHEILHLFRMGATPERSGYLSAFFTLVFYHGLHVVVGIAWMLVMLVQVAFAGLSEKVVYRLLNLRLFWHFQAVMWVFMFTFLYLRGAIV
ncbi:MAG: cytochrome c oxidase subunit 3 [Gammaproteobacteria bacterium]|nr:cytochrome c oxidase subunit 3 [Gammaproteobacteria bacterium]